MITRSETLKKVMNLSGDKVRTAGCKIIKILISMKSAR